MDKIHIGFHMLRGGCFDELAFPTVVLLLIATMVVNRVGPEWDLICAKLSTPPVELQISTPHLRKAP